MKSKPFSVSGFKFYGAKAQIKQSNNKDFGLIWADNPKTVAAALFTTNDVKAAPVQICQRNIKNPTTRLVLVNSGNANAATGSLGLKDALACVTKAASRFKIHPEEILVSSTGKIGVRLPVSKIKAALDLSNPNEQALEDLSQAIMTTDQYPKIVTHEGMLNRKPFKIAIVAKGAGMICPNMATFLCYIVTDLKISKKMANSILKEACENTLNAMTVDGDMSTNDTVVLMASQMAENKSIQTKSKDYHELLKILKELLEKIVLQVCLDGEGATKCFKTKVIRAKSTAQAKKVALSIANSQLVKTAVFGCDPNWGRILCAAGYCSARIKPERATIKIGPVAVYQKGSVLSKNQSKAQKYLANNKVVEILIDLNLGKSESIIYASDLTYEYVRINAEYST